MLNEERVKLMVKLASYEEKQGKQDFKISSYYKSDYTSLNTICTFIWTTIGYAILAIIVGIACMDILLNNLTLMTGFLLCVGIVVVYIIVVIAYCAIGYRFFKKKHSQARQRVKRYSHNLLVLSKLYEKENG